MANTNLNPIQESSDIRLIKTYQNEICGIADICSKSKHPNPRYKIRPPEITTQRNPKKKKRSLESIKNETRNLEMYIILTM